jgi:hypothetical protein
VLPPVHPQLQGTVTPYVTYITASSSTTPSDKFTLPKFYTTLLGVDIVYYSLSKTNTAVDPIVPGIISDSLIDLG